MSRKIARETALKLIYEYSVTGRQNALTYQSLTASGDFSADDLSYIKSVYDGVAGSYDAITALIEKNTEGYRLERIYKMDLSILVLAVYEIKFHKDKEKIPDAVFVNEAVELAKVYSTDKSYSFINGVLAKIINA